MQVHQAFLKATKIPRKEQCDTAPRTDRGKCEKERETGTAISVL